MDYAALPPEVNSGRMYAGPGAGSLLAAGQAWNTLAAELYSNAQSIQSVVMGLTDAPWLGPASASMAAAAVPYVAWMHAAAAQAQLTASQAMVAAAAYDAAFAAMVPPPVIAQNRAQLAILVATNILGQNTPAIMANEAHYAEMWAQDAATMYGYAANSATAATIKPYTAPPQTTNPAGQAGQAAAVSNATRSGAGTSTQVLSQLTSTLPKTLQSLASGGPSGLVTSAAATADPPSVGTVLTSFGDAFTFISSLAFIASGVLFIIPPTISLATSNAAKSRGGGDGGPASGRGASGGVLSPSAPKQPPAMPGSPTSESAGMGRAVPIGRLSAPPSWAGAAPALRSAATALPGAGPSDSEPSGGPGAGFPLGAIGPAGLTAAAAGGGGAAGSGWAAQRSGAAQRQGAPQLPYGYRPTVLPAVAHEAGPREAASAQAGPPAQRALGGEGAPSESLRDEINALRKQIADLAMERDVLMRSAAMWAQQAAERTDG